MSGPPFVPYRPRVETADVENAIPWERRRELGVLRAFRETFVRSVREPTRFYGNAPAEGSVWPALAYGLFFDLVVSVLGFAYNRLTGAGDFQTSIAPYYPQLREVFPQGPEAIGTLLSAASVASLAVTPISYVFNLLVTVFLTWLGVRLAGGLRTSFRHLLRLFAYASWIQVFGLLAITGDVFLGGLSGLLILGFGSYYWLVIVRASQRIDNTRLVVASLYGCLFAAVFACFLGVPLVVGLGWLVYSAVR